MQIRIKGLFHAICSYMMFLAGLCWSKGDISSFEIHVKGTEVVLIISLEPFVHWGD